MRSGREKTFSLKAVRDKPRASNKELPVQRTCAPAAGLPRWTLIPEGQSRGHLGASAGPGGRFWWLIARRLLLCA